ncbi:hypothetical protein K457DRAFT_1882601 [Linnemannia elongata AG-77]|uniref:Uncharacterized protein n=1 Tax=Linnemannia elongata AG-77 TaxID=1314771 RepID=A0A197JAW0_9FUNG|nr:hypothetical protein K457DRAFT_1882601 [Linnemannia elongata AG-77]
MSGYHYLEGMDYDAYQTIDAGHPTTQPQDKEIHGMYRQWTPFMPDDQTCTKTTSADSVMRRRRTMSTYGYAQRARRAHDEIWKDGLGRIDFWGAIATKHYNRERKKRRKEGETEPKEIEWVAASVRACKAALRRIIQWPSTEDRNEGYPGDEKWTGLPVTYSAGTRTTRLLPLEWAKSSRRCQIALPSTSDCSYSAVLLEKEGREKTWKRRWERRLSSRRNSTASPTFRRHKPPEGRPRSQWATKYSWTRSDLYWTCRRSKNAVIDKGLLVRRILDIMPKKRGALATSLEAFAP